MRAPARPMTQEEMSGHMNYDFSFPSVIAPVTNAGKTNRGVGDRDTARDVKEAIVIQDVSADSHGSHIDTPDHVSGFPFRVKGEF